MNVGNFHGRLRAVLLLALWGAFFGIVSSACADAGSRALVTYVAALQSIAEGKHAKGVQLYFKSILLDEFPLSRAVRESDLRKSMAHFQQERQSGRASEVSSLSVALIDRILVNLDPAVSMVDSLRARHPASALLSFLKGEFELARGNRDKAREVFDGLKRLPKPKSFPSLAKAVLERRGAASDPKARLAAMLKQAYLRQDEMDLPGAEKQFRAVMKEFPEDTEAPRALIELLVQDDRAREAAAFLDSRKGETDTLVTPLTLLRIRYAEGRYAEVASLTQPLMVADPQDIYLQTITAECRYLLAQHELALPLFEKLVTADPLNQGFLQRFLACLEICGSPARAVAPLEKYLAANPTDSFMRFEYASALLRVNRLDEARRIFVELKDCGGEFEARAEEKIGAIDFLTFDQVKSHVVEGPGAAPGEGGEREFPAPPPVNPDEGAPEAPPEGEEAKAFPNPASEDRPRTDEDRIKQMKELYR